jgi:hypothetical protein
MEISVTSIVASTRLPAVQIVIDGQRAAQLSCAEARQVGMQLIEAAEAAFSDAAILRIFSDGGLPESAAFAMIGALREMREVPEQDDADSA